MNDIHPEDRALIELANVVSSEFATRLQQNQVRRAKEAREAEAASIPVLNNYSDGYYETETPRQLEENDTVEHNLAPISRHESPEPVTSARTLVEHDRAPAHGNRSESRSSRYTRTSQRAQPYGNDSYDSYRPRYDSARRSQPNQRNRRENPDRPHTTRSLFSRIDQSPTQSNDRSLFHRVSRPQTEHEEPRSLFDRIDSTEPQNPVRRQGRYDRRYNH